MKSAVALLSGGLDSTVSMAKAIDLGINVQLALFFDYGQRAADREREASKRLARYYRVPFREVRLPWLADITRTALVDRGRRLPKASERRPGDRRTAAAVWVPNRNGAFLNIAAAFAESLRADILITGFDREEAATFPDNSVAYIRAVNRAFKYSTANKVQVRSFVAGLDKARIVKLGLELKVPFELLWSCYQGFGKPCGRCESCARSIRALRRNNALDLWRGAL